MLLDFNFCTGSFKFLLDLIGFIFRDLFFDSFRSSFNKSFRFCKAKTRNNCTYFFNYTDLVFAESGKDYIKFALLFNRSSCSATSSGNRNGSSSRYSEFFFHCFYEVSSLDESERADSF